MKIMGIVVSYNTAIVARKNEMVYIRQAVFNNFSGRLHQKVLDIWKKACYP